MDESVVKNGSFLNLNGLGSHPLVLCNALRSSLSAVFVPRTEIDNIVKEALSVGTVEHILNTIYKYIEIVQDTEGNTNIKSRKKIDNESRIYVNSDIE